VIRLSTLGSSPSQMIAVWSPRLSRWWSTQLWQALVVPSWNRLMGMAGAAGAALTADEEGADAQS